MTVIETTNPEVVALRSQLDDMLDQISSVGDTGSLTEVRARIEAARGWAKVHKATADLRLSLLRVEVEALVRIVELGAGEILSTSDRKTAEFLAGMTRPERDGFVKASGSATTAAGMVRSHLKDQELIRLRAEQVARGMAYASKPSAPSGEGAVGYAKSVREVLRDVMDDYTRDGAPFSVAQMADDLISDAAIGEADDPAIAEGIREVCRKAIGAAPVVKLGDSILPRLVTTRSADGNYVRIPVENAQVRHLEDMVALRREQLAQDSAALDELETVLARLRKMPGADDESRIGALVAQSVLSGGESR